jgi:hypothetical protein
LFCRGVGVSNLVSVQATPVYTSASTTEDFTSNTLSVTSVSTGYEYALTNGNDYTISSSSNFLSTSYHAYYPYNAYIDDTTSEWISGSGYDSTLGTYTGSYSTIVDEVIISGEWTQVMMPYPLRITSANFINNTNGSFSGFIRDFVLVGSNDGYTWTNLYEGESVLSASLTEIAITITGNTNYYYYLRLIIKSINIESTAVERIAIKQIRYYGETYADNTVINTTLVNKTLKVVGGAGVTGNMTVAGDIGVIGDANVDGSMNVVGNVLLTSGSSAEQQVHIRATTVSTDTISGRWWWRVGRCIWKREYG